MNPFSRKTFSPWTTEPRVKRNQQTGEKGARFPGGQSTNDSLPAFAYTCSTGITWGELSGEITDCQALGPARSEAWVLLCQHKRNDKSVAGHFWTAI